MFLIVNHGKAARLLKFSSSSGSAIDVLVSFWHLIRRLPAVVYADQDFLDREWFAMASRYSFQREFKFSGKESFVNIPLAPYFVTPRVGLGLKLLSLNKTC